MVEAFQEHDLGPDVDRRGNLLNEIRKPVTLDEAVWKIDKERQDQAAPYIDLKQKIEDLPKFEKTAVKTMILEFLSGEMAAHGEAYRNYGIVQSFGGSGQPLSYWEQCTFNTEDGKFEEYLNKVRPAVEGMLADEKESGKEIMGRLCADASVRPQAADVILLRFISSEGNIYSDSK